MKEKLSSLNKSKFDEIKMNVGMGGYKKYKSFFLQFKREMQREIKSAITLLNNSDTSGVVKEQEKNDLLILALKKIITFIKVREFGTINNLGGKVKGKMLQKYADYKEKQKKEKSELIEELVSNASPASPKTHNAKCVRSWRFRKCRAAAAAPIVPARFPVVAGTSSAVGSMMLQLSSRKCRRIGSSS